MCLVPSMDFINMIGVRGNVLSGIESLQMLNRLPRTSVSTHVLTLRPWHTGCLLYLVPLLSFSSIIWICCPSLMTPLLIRSRLASYHLAGCTIVSMPQLVRWNSRLVVNVMAMREPATRRRKSYISLTAPMRSVRRHSQHKTASICIWRTSIGFRFLATRIVPT